MSVALACLLLPLAGWIGVRRLLGEPCRITAVVAALPVGAAVLLVGVNLLLRGGASMGEACSGTLAVLGLATLLATLRAREPELAPSRPSPLFLGFLALGAGLLFGGTWLLRNAGPDFDFWIDLPQQGLLARGLVPPPNPFFPDLRMEGHYGGNLLVAVAAELAGAPLPEVGAAVAAACQALTFLLGGLALAGARERELPAACAVSLAFLGLCVGGWAGLADSSYHLYPLAHCALATTLYVGARALRVRSAGALFLAVLAAAALALVFELYLVLGAAASALIVPPESRRRWAALLVLAAPLVLLQGGPLSHVLETRPPRSSPLQTQTQTVTLGFPRRPFLSLHLQPWDYWRTSLALRTLPAVSRRVPLPEAAREAPLLSLDVLRLHWLPTWLAPLTAWAAWRLRDRVAGFFWLFGAVAFLTPGVVGLGPVYDREYYRWELAAGLGFALGLGLVAPRLAATRWAAAAAMALLALILGPGAVHVVLLGRAAAMGAPGGEQEWLVRHRGRLGITASELEAARWLRRRALPQDRLLFRAPAPRPSAGLRLSTVLGVARLPAAGQALPLAADFVGMPPFRASGQARLFWRSPGPVTLAPLQADWIMVSGEALTPFPGVAEAVRVTAPDGTVTSVYRAQRRTSREPHDLPPPSRTANWTWAGAPTAGRVVAARLASPGAEGVLEISVLDPRTGETETTRQPLHPDGQFLVPLPWEPGRFVVSGKVLEGRGTTGVIAREVDVQPDLLRGADILLP